MLFQQTSKHKLFRTWWDVRSKISQARNDDVGFRGPGCPFMEISDYSKLIYSVASIGLLHRTYIILHRLHRDSKLLKFTCLTAAVICECMPFQANFQVPHFRTWCEVYFKPPQACSRTLLKVGIRVLRELKFFVHSRIASAPHPQEFEKSCLLPPYTLSFFTRPHPDSQHSQALSAPHCLRPKPAPVIWKTTKNSCNLFHG